MPRSAESIQAEIDNLEAYLESQDSLIDQAGAGATMAKQASREVIQKRLDSLYIMLDRANGTNPMEVRGRIDGLGLFRT